MQAAVYPGDDLLSELDTAGVEILEEPKIEFDKKVEEGEEPTDLDLVQDFSDKTNDPVRMYLREMGTVPLLTREGEIELAKRIERGQAAVRKSLSRSPLPLNTHQCTSRQTPRSCMLRSVAPAPISMSSECAPRQRTDN